MKPNLLIQAQHSIDSLHSYHTISISSLPMVLLKPTLRLNLDQPWRFSFGANNCVLPVFFFLPLFLRRVPHLPLEQDRWLVLYGFTLFFAFFSWRPYLSLRLLLQRWLRRRQQPSLLVRIGNGGFLHFDVALQVGASIFESNRLGSNDVSCFLTCDIAVFVGLLRTMLRAHSCIALIYTLDDRAVWEPHAFADGESSNAPAECRSTLAGVGSLRRPLGRRAPPFRFPVLRPRQRRFIDGPLRVVLVWNTESLVDVSIPHILFVFGFTAIDSFRNAGHRYRRSNFWAPICPLEGIR